MCQQKELNLMVKSDGQKDLKMVEKLQALKKQGDYRELGTIFSGMGITYYGFKLHIRSIFRRQLKHNRWAVIPDVHPSANVAVKRLRRSSEDRVD